MRLIVPRSLRIGSIVLLFMLSLTTLAGARDRPYSSAELNAFKKMPPTERIDTNGSVSGSTGTGGQFSKSQIENFRCTSAGDPTTVVDISCNTSAYGQNWAPDNELTIAVNPENPNHLVAGSNDYFYRFNNSTGARQALVPTGFFTSFDGGRTWIDGQIPLRSGNGAGDPAPAFDARHDVVMMAQLENTGGQGAANLVQGDISVSRSTDGGVTWSEPITVMKGGGNANQANRATFYDKEWLTVDNNPGSAFYGRAYLTATVFQNGPHASYAGSPIALSYSDDGGLTWSQPKIISGSHPSCTYQETGGGTDCDEDQFSIPEVAPDGTLHVSFLNGQNEAAWEVPFDFDSQILVVTSTNGGQTFSGPVQVAQLEDGLSDMPFSVINRQTVWGHQIRWTSAGNITVNPANPAEITVVWSDRDTANPNATEGCFYNLPGDPPNYDPCNAGPGSDLDIYYARSNDGGATWSARAPVEDDPGAAWFPWADYLSDGTLVVAWDQDTQPSPADAFVHVLKIGGAASEPLTSFVEQVDVSVTHWTGQYVGMAGWPRICGPAGYSDPPVVDATGKDCNVFHGDYTGLAVGPDDSINVVWTGLNVWTTSPQLDFYTGAPHDGFRQDAMFARRYRE
jgi:hypothetical protein